MISEHYKTFTQNIRIVKYIVVYKTHKTTQINFKRKKNYSITMQYIGSDAFENRKQSPTNDSSLDLIDFD